VRLTGTCSVSSGSAIRPPDNQVIFGPAVFRNTGSAILCFDLFSGDSRNVTLSDLEIDGFAERGVRIWHGAFLRRLDIHHCELTGIGNNCQSEANLGIVIDSCDIHDNGNLTTLGNNTGGLKVTFVGHPTQENDPMGGSSLIVRNCHVYDNIGSGLWTDHGCNGILFEHNLCENNVRNGIMHELSIGCGIVKNICQGNEAVQIAAISSAYVDIIRNKVGNGSNPLIRSRESFRSDIPGGNDWENPGEPGILLPTIANTGKGYPTYTHNILNNSDLNDGALASANVQRSISNDPVVPGGGIINYDATVVPDTEQIIVVPRLMMGLTVHAPTVSQDALPPQTVGLDTLEMGMQLHAPIVVSGSIAIVVPTIDLSMAVHQPTVTQGGGGPEPDPDTDFWFLPPVIEGEYRYPPDARLTGLGVPRSVAYRGFIRTPATPASVEEALVVDGETYLGGRWAGPLSTSQYDALVAAGYSDRIYQAENAAELPRALDNA
jgi:hypothetical protein